MKKIILLIALLLTSFAFSQKINLKNLDSIQFINNCDKIITDTGKSFKKVSDGTLDWKSYFKYTDENNESIFIVYYTINEGENKDLEIKGTKKWIIDAIASKYLTVFNLYTLYFNPKADKERIQKIGTDLDNPEGGVLRKTSQEGLWEIKTRL